MATCKDCICFDILCRDTLQEDELKLCDSFKNKADFVEVVRCKDCKFCEHTRESYHCVPGRHSVRSDDYCSYGQRKSK